MLVLFPLLLLGRPFLNLPRWPFLDLLGWSCFNPLGRSSLDLPSTALDFLRKLPKFLVEDKLQRSFCLAFRKTAQIEIVCRIFKEPVNEFRIQNSSRAG